ncbi:Amino-acid acetyltransferase, mitochondrial [Coemansia furcata]|uniref:Amino-acid acetyltransferase, mitochondrial n=1 Tax=Coemansia furcata TaxID=417177 RepID=A0ACC1LRB9_9FUNG|nr:Amino-acid acetyltransferase, mitochondrial [Coemansia furcata]
MLRLRHWAAVRRPLAALLSGTSNPPQLTRERELILSVLSTVPSPREARKFIDSVSGRETLRSQREFEEQQARLAIEDATGVSPSTVELQYTRVPTRTLAALVCVDAVDACQVGKLLAQMQRIGVAPVVLVASATGGDHRDAVLRAHALADAVEREGGRARPICGGVFSESAVDGEPVAASIAAGQIPVVAPLAVDATQRLRVLDARSVAVPALARALAALEQGGSMSVARLILLGDAPGVVAGGELRRLVNLEEDYGRLEAAEPAGALQLMRTCLGILAPTTVGIVASVRADPSLVLKGLISERPVSQLKKPDTPKPRGAEYQASHVEGVPEQFTLLRHGFRIQRHTSLDTCDVERLCALLERSFGRTLDRAGYLERLRRCAGGIQVIVAGEYQGAVIVTYEKTSGRDLPYLDKFAVLPEVQGTGMADILWEQLRAACPSCLWRSRNDNGVNRWYFDRSHGHVRSPEGKGGTRWVFFWYQGQKGVLGPGEVSEGVDVAQRIPASFI